MVQYHFDKALAHAALMLMVLCAPAWAFTKEGMPRFKAASLPDLGDPGEKEAGYFTLDERELTVGYDTRFNKWSASADYQAGEGPVFNANYGLMLSKELASGANLTMGRNYKEVFLNEVFSPQRDIRLRFAGGQLLQNNFQLQGYEEAGTVSQNSYLLELRKSWGRTSALSGVGLTLFDVRANLRAQAAAAATDEEFAASPSPAYARGSMQGYAFNFRLEPSTRSRIDFDLGSHRSTSFLGELIQKQTTADSYRIHLTHYLSNCSRLQTEYSTSANAQAINVMMGRGAWSLGFSSALAAEDSSREYTVNLSYAIPLDGWAHARSRCGFGQQATYAFSPMVEDAIARPAQIPAVPLIAE